MRNKHRQVPIKEEESGHYREKKQNQRKKRVIILTTRMAETNQVTDLKRQLVKQTSSIDQITKVLKPLQKYITTTTERQFKSIRQIEVANKAITKTDFRHPKSRSKDQIIVSRIGTKLLLIVVTLSAKRAL